MAKKKIELSLEEKLEQAVVPVDEQPYEVPDNWCWTTLENIAKWGSGGTPSRKNKEYYEGNIPWLKTGELNDGYIYDSEEKISEEAIKKSSAKLFKKGSVLIAMYGATIGKTGILSIDATTNQACACADCKEGISNKFLFYYLQSEKNNFIAKGKGGAQPNISQEIIKTHRFPLPPIEEQGRIVEAIESMFAKLDDAKEIAEEIVASAKLRKMSILYETFSGKLTANWRQKNGVSDESWQEKTLNEVCKSIYDGDHMPPPKSESGIPFLVISNVNKGILSFENTRFVPEEYYENITDTRKPEKGDLLYTLVGSYGIPVMVDDDRAFCFQRHMGLLKPNRIDAKFLWYQMQSQEFYDKATGIANGTAQLTVPIKGLRKLKIFCPTKEEQMEIVSLLDKIWEKESITEQIVSGVIEDIDALKKSILAKAFRGELGTNIESEESSIELLKQILEVS